MDIDRAEGIGVRRTTIIGESESYKELRARQSNVPSVCYRRRVTGVDIHTWTIFKGYGGTEFDTIKFSGFSDTGCRESYTMNMDDHVRFICCFRTKRIALTFVTELEARLVRALFIFPKRST